MGEGYCYLKIKQKSNKVLKLLKGGDKGTGHYTINRYVFNELYC